MKMKMEDFEEQQKKETINNNRTYANYKKDETKWNLFHET